MLTGAFSSVEEIPENLVHDHEKNGLPRLSSLPPREITHRLVNKRSCSFTRMKRFALLSTTSPPHFVFASTD